MGATRLRPRKATSGTGMTAKPWFKFHVADFRAEMLLLTPAQRGAYISLLMYYWENEGLPDDDHVLAKIAGMRIEDWRRNRASVRRNFTPGWGHPRTNRLLTEWLDKSNKNKEAALQMHSRRRANAYANAVPRARMSELKNKNLNGESTDSDSLQGAFERTDGKRPDQVTKVEFEEFLKRRKGRDF
jgi:uncharacterized protein YdaU (DUF1376 family)